VQFGPQWSARHVLSNGKAVTLRLVEPGDAEEFDRQFRRMSPDSRYRRFFSGLTELSPDTLHYLTVVDGYDHFAVVAIVDSLDLKEESGAGVARFIRSPELRDVADAAVTVIDDFQGFGLGRILMTTLVLAARERDVKKFRGEVLASNEPMKKLLEANGAVGTLSEAGTLVFDVPIDEGEEDSPLRRILRDTAASLIVWLGRFYPPGARRV
jgi:GNAT superfamily N-acetyltransferase